MVKINKLKPRAKKNGNGAVYYKRKYLLENPEKELFEIVSQHEGFILACIEANTTLEVYQALEFMKDFLHEKNLFNEVHYDDSAKKMYLVAKKSFLESLEIAQINYLFRRFTAGTRLSFMGDEKNWIYI